MLSIDFKWRTLLWFWLPMAVPVLLFGRKDGEFNLLLNIFLAILMLAPAVVAFLFTVPFVARFQSLRFAGQSRGQAVARVAGETLVILAVLGVLAALNGFLTGFANGLIDELRARGRDTLAAGFAVVFCLLALWLIYTAVRGVIMDYRYRHSLETIDANAKRLN